MSVMETILARPPVQVGRLFVDPSGPTVRWGDASIKLTAAELAMLYTLASRAGRVQTRNQLMDAAYHEDIYIDERTIDSHLKRLRNKFKRVDPEFHEIETLYGMGYRINGTASVHHDVPASSTGQVCLFCGCSS